MPKRDFEEALREASTSLDGGMPDEVGRRLRARLQTPSQPRWGRWFALAATAAAVALLIVLLRPSTPAELGGLAVVTRSADLKFSQAPDGLVELSAGHCTLADRALGARLEVASGAVLRRRPQGLELRRGSVDVEVDAAGVRDAPYQVEVAWGVLAVLGASVTVRVEGEEGSVVVRRGVVRFQARDGRALTVPEGQTLTLPLEVVPPVARPTLEPPVIAPPSPAKAPAAPPHLGQVVRGPVATPAVALPSSEALLEQLATMRSRGQYQEAAERLVAALRDERNPATRERLSFELGSILSTQLRDPVRACAQWRVHLREFPAGRYGQEVGQLREQLRCEE